MTIISLDSSISKCGFAVVQEGNKVLCSGVIKTKADTDMSDRLLELSNNLKEILGCKDYNITHAVIEIRGSFSYTRSTGRGGKSLNQNALHKNSEAIGAIRLTLKQWGIPITAIEATQWKGRRGKKYDIMVAQQYKKSVKDDNEADAILLGIYHQNMMCHGSPTNV